MADTTLKPSPSIYDLLPRGNGSSTTALVAAVAAAARAKAYVRLQPGATYYFDADVVLTDQDVRIDATGALLVMRANENLVVADQSWTRIDDVIAFTDGQKIQVADAAAYTPGRAVKIVSDDQMPSSYVQSSGSTEYRQGEFARVYSVDTTTDIITLDRPLRLTHTTNPRVGLMGTKTFHVFGGEWKYEEGHAAAWSGGDILTAKCYDRPVVDIEISRGYGAGVSLISTLDARADVSPSGLHNLDHAGQYGYGIQEAGSQGTVARIHGGVTRHGYTTTAAALDADAASLAYYGGVAGFSVEGLMGGAASAHFDTHHGAEDGVFKNCVSLGSRQSNINAQGGSAFQARGRRLSYVAPFARGARNGFYAFSEADREAPTTDVHVLDANIQDCDQYALRSNDVGELYISGGVFQSNVFQTARFEDTGTVYLDGVVRIVVGESLTGSPGAFEIENATIVNRGHLILDFSQSTGAATTAKAFRLSGTLASFTGGKVTIIPPAGGASYLADVVNDATTGGVGVFAPEELVYGPGMGHLALAGGAKTRASDGSTASSDQSVSITADGQALALHGAADPVVYCRLQPSGGSWTLGKIDAGAFKGQVLFLRVASASGNSIKVPSSVASFRTSLTGAANIVLSEGEVLGLVWLNTPFSDTGSWGSFGVIKTPKVTTNVADADLALTMASPRVVHWYTDLAANRTVTLPATLPVEGEEFYVHRDITALGNFKLAVVAVSTTLINLRAGGWARFKYNGSVWRLVGAGHTGGLIALPGDADLALSAGGGREVRYMSALTADRTLTLPPVADCALGDVVHVMRGTAATGNCKLIISDAGTVRRNLRSGEVARFVCDGSTWTLSGIEEFAKRVELPGNASYAMTAGCGRQIYFGTALTAATKKVLLPPYADSYEGEEVLVTVGINVGTSFGVDIRDPNDTTTIRAIAAGATASTRRFMFIGGTWVGMG